MFTLNTVSPLVRITALLLLFVVAATTYFMYNPFKKTLAHTFSCPGLEGFTFKYPASPEWGDESTLKKHAEDTFCFVVFSTARTTGNKPAQFTVRKIARPGYPAPGSPAIEYPPKLAMKNPHGISYLGDSMNSFPGKPATEAIHSVVFYTDGFAVEIQLNGMDSLGESFSSVDFFKTVIESFAVSSDAISSDDAMRIAQHALQTNNPDADVVIENDQTIEKEYGWIFFFTTKKYLETKNPSYVIPGTGPVVVTRDGSVHFLTSSVPPAKAIQAFEQTLQ